MEKEWIRRIRAVIRNCENIQDSNESDYTKQAAKKEAYELIVEIIGKENVDGRKDQG